LHATKHEDGLMSAELKSLLDSSGRDIEIEKGTYIFQEGKPASNIYIVNSGLVQMSKLSDGGKELTLRICKAGSVFGELVMFTNNAAYLLNAKVLKSGSVKTISKNILEEQFKENGELAVEFIKWSSHQMRLMQYKIRDLVLFGKNGALCSTLIRLSNTYGINQQDGILIDLSLTDQELAAFAAATRESANRLMIKLRNKDIVTIDDSGRILIKDIDYLKRQVGCESCPIDICTID